MTNPDPQPTPPTPPTSATVHNHLSLVQWLSTIAAIIGAVTSYLQILPASVSWAQPALMFLGLVGVIVGATLKTLNSGNLCLLILMGIGIVLPLGGCSNMTTNQRLHAGEVGYIAADVALTAADAAGKIPASAKPEIVSAMTDFSARLTDAQDWVDANPTLANTPGVSPPSLDALDIVRATVRKYVLRYGLFAPLPAPRIPSTQPVLIPIPG